MTPDDLERRIDWATLARRCMTGDNQAAIDLIAGLDPEINLVCSRYRGANRDDAKAECVALLWCDVIPNFVIRGCPGFLPALAFTAFRYRLIALRKAAGRVKRGGRATIESLTTEPADTTTNPAIIAANTDAAGAMMKHIITMANPLARRAIPHLLNGHSYTEAAKLIKAPLGTVTHAIRELRARLHIDDLCIEQVKAGAIIGRFPTAAAAARQTGISSECIRQVLRGNAKSAGGCNWRYAKGKPCDSE